jgi:hypothetical protein
MKTHTLEDLTDKYVGKVGTSQREKFESLYIFLEEKNIVEGIRISLENFGKYQNIRTISLYAVSTLSD